MKRNCVPHVRRTGSEPFHQEHQQDHWERADRQSEAEVQGDAVVASAVIIRVEQAEADSDRQQRHGGDEYGT